MIFEWCCAQVNTDVLDTVLLSLHPAEVPADIKSCMNIMILLKVKVMNENQCNGYDHDSVEGGGGERGGVPEEQGGARPAPQVPAIIWRLTN